MSAELSPEYVSALRAMTGVQKLEAAARLYSAARRLKTAALREQHPDWSEDRVEKEVREIFFRASS